MALPDTRSELKLRFLWLAIGYALVALVIYLSLTSSPVDIEMDSLIRINYFMRWLILH